MNNTVAFDEQIRDLHAQAEGHYSAGDLQSARQIWEAILQIAPGDQRAEEGLRLTSLADANWSLVEASAGGTPQRAARIAQVREYLGSGLPGEAERLAQELAREAPEDEELKSLVQMARQALERSALTVEGLRDARLALSQGDRLKAAELCRRVLEIDAGDREAKLLLEQAQGLARPASSPPGNDLELDLDATVQPAPQRTPPPAPAVASEGELELDLPLAPQPGAAVVTCETAVASPPAPAGAPLGDDPVSVRDLFDAAEEMTDSHGSSELPTNNAVVMDPARDEAALLVSRARGELKQGKFAEASELASQAMALSESVPGAQSVLDQARAEMDKRASQAENLLVEGVSLFDDDKAAEAIPLFEQALELVPGHCEILEYLAKARVATGGGDITFEEDLSSMASIPLASVAPPASSEELLDLDLDTSTAPSLDGAPPSPPPLDAPPPPAPPLEAISTPPVPPLEAADGVDAPPVAPLMPESPPAETAAAARGSSPKGRSSSSSPAPVRRLLIGAVVLALVGAGGWYGYQWWFSRAQAKEDTAQAGLALSVDESAESSIVPAEELGSTPEPLPVAPAAPETPASASASPRYTRADVPRLLARASRALAKGQEKEALDLLLAAQDADPSNFAILDKIQQAQESLRQREDAEERIALGRQAFAEGSYEEALRVFYRIPKPFQPRAINRWIANGWYNLGVHALQAGDVVEANRFFSDCLELSPNDHQAMRDQEVARRYRRRGLDDAYRMYVTRLKLRVLEEAP